MTTLNEARGAIYTAFVAGWGTTSDFTLDDETYTPPSDTAWCRTVVRHNARQQESLGGVGRRKFEAGGSVFMQCFGPLDTGTEVADTLAAVAQGIFEGKTLTPEGIRFTSSAVLDIGPTEDHYQINVEAVFTYTETK